jgi:DNA-binding GntR family transcriptional regulator
MATKVPKYMQIKNELSAMIERQEFLPGEKLFTEAQIKAKYNVSTITVVRALQEMVNEGYLVREQGKGTFVSRTRKKQLVHFSDIETFAGKRETSKVLTMVEARAPEILDALKLTTNDSYFTFVRLHYIEDIPFIYHRSHIPAMYVDNAKKPEDFASIYTRIWQDFAINPYQAEARETNSIASTTPMDVARLLRVSPNTMSVLQEKTTVIKNGDVLEYAIGYKLPAYFSIQFETPQFAALYNS